MLQDGMVMFNIKDGKKTNEADHLKRYRSTVHGRRTARFVQRVKTKKLKLDLVLWKTIGDV